MFVHIVTKGESRNTFQFSPRHLKIIITTVMLQRTDQHYLYNNNNNKFYKGNIENQYILINYVSYTVTSYYHYFYADDLNFSFFTLHPQLRQDSMK